MSRSGPNWNDGQSRDFHGHSEGGYERPQPRQGNGGENIYHFGRGQQSRGQTQPNNQVRKVFYTQGNKRNYSPGTVSSFRKDTGIIVKSQHDRIDDPFITWEDSPFTKDLLAVISKQKFEYPTPIQAQIFPILLGGHDLIGIAETGSGKTFAFLIPGIIHLRANKADNRDGPTMLILAPTRELAMQIQGQAELFRRDCEVSSLVVYGGVERGEQGRALRRGVDILVATPGRLIDFVESNTTSLRNVTFLVIDEADRMLDMGFEPQVRKICDQIRKERQTCYFSATWPPEVRKLADEICKGDPIHIQVGSDNLTINKGISQFVTVCPNRHAKRDELYYVLDQLTIKDKVLIFAKTKAECERLSIELTNSGYDCMALHGDKTQQQRDSTMKAFKSGDCRLVAATDVASRGLDIRDITHVVVFDLPNTIEDYIHRIGRTGRAGDMGVSITLIDSEREDATLARKLIDFLTKADQNVPQELRDFADGVAFNRSSYRGRGRGRGRVDGGYDRRPFGEGRGNGRNNDFFEDERSTRAEPSFSRGSYRNNEGNVRDDRKNEEHSRDSGRGGRGDDRPRGYGREDRQPNDEPRGYGRGERNYDNEPPRGGYGRGGRDDDRNGNGRFGQPDNRRNNDFNDRNQGRQTGDNGRGPQTRFNQDEPARGGRGDERGGANTRFGDRGNVVNSDPPPRDYDGDGVRGSNNRRFNERDGGSRANDEQKVEDRAVNNWKDNDRNGQDRGGYGNNRGGYGNDRDQGNDRGDRGGFNNDRNGFGNNRGDNDNHRGGYNRSGYGNDRGGDRGYGNDRGGRGYGNDRGGDRGYGNDRGGDRGYGNDRGGDRGDDRGYGNQRGGFRNYGNDRGGDANERGGYNPENRSQRGVRYNDRNGDQEGGGYRGNNNSERGPFPNSRNNDRTTGYGNNQGNGSQWRRDENDRGNNRQNERGDEPAEGGRRQARYNDDGNSQSRYDDKSGPVVEEPRAGRKYNDDVETKTADPDVVDVPREQENNPRARGGRYQDQPDNDIGRSADEPAQQFQRSEQPVGRFGQENRVVQPQDDSEDLGRAKYREPPSRQLLYDVPVENEVGK